MSTPIRPVHSIAYFEPASISCASIHWHRPFPPLSVAHSVTSAARASLPSHPSGHVHHSPPSDGRRSPPSFTSPTHKLHVRFLLYSTLLDVSCLPGLAARSPRRSHTDSLILASAHLPSSLCQSSSPLPLARAVLLDPASNCICPQLRDWMPPSQQLLLGQCPSFLLTSLSPVRSRVSHRDLSPPVTDAEMPRDVRG